MHWYWCSKKFLCFCRFVWAGVGDVVVLYRFFFFEHIHKHEHSNISLKMCWIRTQMSAVRVCVLACWVSASYNINEFEWMRGSKTKNKLSQIRQTDCVKKEITVEMSNWIHTINVFNGETMRKRTPNGKKEKEWNWENNTIITGRTGNKSYRIQYTKNVYVLTQNSQNDKKHMWTIFVIVRLPKCIWICSLRNSNFCAIT